MIITRKIQLFSESKTFYDTINSLNRVVYLMKNRVMSRLYLAEAEEQRIMDEQEVDTKFFNAEWYKDRYGMSKQNLGYNTTAVEFSEITSYVRSPLAACVFADFKNDIKEVKAGKRTQRTYRYGCPIPIVKQAIAKMDEDGFVFMMQPVKFVYGADKSNNRAIIKRILSGEYSMSNSFIKREGKKVYLLLCVNIPEKNHELKNDVVASVDISMKMPFVLTSNATKKEEQIGDPAHLIALRIQFNRRYESLQANMVYCKGGHGRKRKMKGMDRLEQAEIRVAQTINHQQTARLIQRILQMQAKKLIITGDKSQLPEEQSDKFARNFVHRFWNYGDIVTKIVYKCKLHGIEVVNLFAKDKEEE